MSTIKREDGTPISPAEIVAGDRLTLVRDDGTEMAFVAQFSAKTPEERAEIAQRVAQKRAEALRPPVEEGQETSNQSGVAARAARAAANAAARAIALAKKT